MAGLSVPLSQLQRGDFPMVCAMSGRPADVKLAVSFRSRRGQPAVWGMLPFASSAQRRLHVLVRVRYSVLFGGFVTLLVLTAFRQWTAVKFAGAPVVVVALVLNVFGALLSIDGRPDATGRFVHLHGVHRRFVSAVLRSAGR